MGRTRWLFPLALLLFIPRLAAQPAGVEERVESLLGRMTLEEKIGQLLQYTGSQPDLRGLAVRGAAGSIFNFDGVDRGNALQRAAVEESRLRIPLLFAGDIIHGCRTVFPIPLGIASSWDPAAAELAARIAAREASAGGLRWTFAPMVDIARDPRWGRVAEGSGEDPFLGAAMAAAYVRGFQGKDLSAPDSILACAKHFAAYGAAEGGRDYNAVDMSERKLREVYLPPFKAAVDAGVETIMTAFNSLNGVPSTANGHLLKEILRDDWGFRGLVDTDWEAIKELVDHAVAPTPEDAALMAIKAGVDMDMVDGSFRSLVAAVRSGSLQESRIDESVRRVLRAKFALGLFERPYTDEAREKSVVLAKEHVDAARSVARESIVLLKNESALLPLPLSKPATIAVIGPLADSKADVLGPWAGFGRPEEAVTVLQGLRTRAGSRAQITYAKGCGVHDGTAEEMADAMSVAAKSDVVLLVEGEDREMSGEASSRAFLDLPGRQEELLEAIAATGKPIVLIILSGRPLTIPWAAAHAAAIVWAWFPGSQAGNALADVLFGDVNPSGKLPISIPRSVGQIPVYFAHLPTGRPEKADDKYTSKYLDSPNDPLYPFGYGLSYTRFDYSGLRVMAGENRTFVVSADIHNAGTRAGDEIVQLYIRDPVMSVSRPVRELKGFRRVTLRAGETRRVELTLVPNDLRYWSDGGWKVEPGMYRVWIGPSSVKGLEGTFEVK